MNKIQKVKKWYEEARNEGVTIKEMLEAANKGLSNCEKAKLLILIAYDLDLVSADVVVVNSKWRFDV